VPKFSPFIQTATVIGLEGVRIKLKYLLFELGCSLFVPTVELFGAESSLSGLESVLFEL
jgi:hypothetical protein